MNKVAMTRVVLGPLQWAVQSLRVEASWTPFALVCRWGYPTSGRRVGPDGDPDFGDEPEAGSHKRCDANSSLTFLQKGDRHGRDPKPEHGNRGSQGPSSRERGGVDPADEVPYERRRHRRTPRDSVDAALKAVQRARAAFAAALDGELEFADELRRAQPNVH